MCVFFFFSLLKERCPVFILTAQCIVVIVVFCLSLEPKGTHISCSVFLSEIFFNISDFCWTEAFPPQTVNLMTR